MRSLVRMRSGCCSSYNLFNLADNKTSLNLMAGFEVKVEIKALGLDGI